MDLKEEVIWQKIRLKDERAFELFYKERYRSFFLIACKYLKDPGQAEEIVNDVFLKIWEDADKITIDSSLKSYMYKAIINRSINALNKDKREFNHQVSFVNTVNEAYELQEIEENELKIKLYTAIGKLPEKCRQVFEMSRFEELKQQDIADRLGISIKTVKNHITLALKMISKAITLYFLFLIPAFEFLFYHGMGPLFLFIVI